MTITRQYRVASSATIYAYFSGTHAIPILAKVLAILQAREYSSRTKTVLTFVRETKQPKKKTN